MASYAFLYGIPFLPNIFPALIVVMAFGAIDAIIFIMYQVGKQHRLIQLPLITLVVNLNFFRILVNLLSGQESYCKKH